MEESKKIINTGLRGVTVASTRISHVDGEAGKLIYRGFPIFDLSDKTSYEEIVHLLLYESLPNQNQLKELKNRLANDREIPADLVAVLNIQPAGALPMDILQASIALLAGYDPNPAELTIENSRRIAKSLIAKIPTIVAAWHRIRKGHKTVDPDPALNHAENFLYMMTGQLPEKNTARFFDTCLVLHAEHSFNASTFSARQIASTRAHMYAAVAGAVGSLSGELHGGANTRVMHMLETINSVEGIDDYIANVLETGGKLMGLGHAVYKTGDPRARILAPMSKKLGETTGDTKWYDMSVMLEEKGKKAFKEKKGIDIYPNVDFYSASLYHYMGIPADLFTPVFAVSRIAGWAAHVIEEQFGGADAKPALYRPSSEYIGEYCGPAECEFVPMEKR